MADLNSRILIVGNPYSDFSTRAFLNKLLSILSPTMEDISVIGGEGPCSAGNITYYRGPPPNYINEKLFLLRIIQFVLFQVKLCALIIRIKSRPNIVIFLPSTFILPMLLIRMMCLKVILYAGGSASNNAKYDNKKFNKNLIFPIVKIIEAISFTLSNRIIIESRSSLEFEGLVRYRKKVVIAGLYVNTNNFSDHAYAKKDKIGYIGSLSELKGVLNFTKSILYLIDEVPHIKVSIIGGGPMYDDIKTFIDEHDLSENVRLLGWIPHIEVPEHLNRFSLLILPSCSEGLPNIILESMACGTPVLATHVGAIPDIIKDGETGFIMENNSPLCIAKNIIRALNTSDLDKISINARKLIEKDFTYDSAIIRWKKFIEDI